MNVGRSAVLAAGWPESVPATTIDRQCGSSQQAAAFAAQGVIAGAYDIVVAAGVEVMSTTPMGASVTPGSFPMGPRVMERYAERGGLVMQGTSAEIIADKWDLSREDLDTFAARSQQFAEQATKEGRFENEIIPVKTKVLRPRVRQRRRERRDGQHRRGHPPRHHRRDAGQAQAGVQGRRQGHRRQQLADHRRRVGRADHERGAGQRSSGSRRGPGSTPSACPASTRSRC